MYSKNSFYVGNVMLGGMSPVVIQSMTNTNTSDAETTAAQCRRMVDAGAQMVRITVPSLREVAAMREIGTLLHADGYDVPLIADVHFNPKVAETVAPVVDKVRINPGNYTDKRNFSQLNQTDAEYQADVERMGMRAAPLFAVCKQNDTAIRIGINHGSLCDRVVSRYGNTPEAMVQSALEWTEICDYYGFHKVVISMKSSNVQTMIEATLLLKQAMDKRQISYPLHLGVTEAGNGWDARVKSAVGIGTLLMMGVGDTIRVSLTEPPENEIPFARTLVQTVSTLNPNDLIIKENIMHYTSVEPQYERWVAAASAMTGYACCRHHISDIRLENPHFNYCQIHDLETLILQACRIRMNKTEFIACPSCGRTQYDIQSVFERVKSELSDYPGLKIAIMGCIVNGPGEMADADFGIVGASHGLVCVYEGKHRLTQAIPVTEAINMLHTLVEERQQA